MDELLAKLFGHSGPTFSPWVDVDLDAAFNVLDRAFRTAVALRETGLEFAHAPILRPDGEVLTRVGDYAVSVFPFLDGTTDRPVSDRHRLLVALGRLHASTDALPPGLAQRDSLTVPLKSRCLEALDDLRSPWALGPYGELARALLRKSAGAIRDAFHRCDELAGAVRAADEPWVVTHGQMHGGNIIQTDDNTLILVDWESVAVAPRERDLGTWGNNLDPKTDEDWAAYASVGQPRGIAPNAMELYRLIGLLWGICNDTEIFRNAHVDNGDTRHEWNELQVALSAIGD